MDKGKTNIYAVNTNFAGVRNTDFGPVEFKRGVGVGSKKQAAELEARGYSLKPIDGEATEEITEQKVTVNNTVAEIEAYAAKKEIDLGDATVKAEMIAVIEEAEGAE